VIPLIPVEEAHFAKSVAEAEFGFRIVREFPPFPINLADAGISPAAAADGTKLIAVTRSAKATEKAEKALEAALRENNIRKLYYFVLNKLVEVGLALCRSCNPIIGSS
jgi:hypothetical protein